MCLISIFAQTMFGRVSVLTASSMITLYRTGWNHRFTRRVSKYHPNVWHIFDCFKREEVVCRQQATQNAHWKRKEEN